MGKRNTILVVDDMDVNRAIICSLFEQEYELIEAENGWAALRLLAEYHESIAVMLLDIIMPGKDGYQVLREMDREGFLSSVPVVVITAEDSSESEVRSFDLGAADIVLKPFEPHVVKRRVKNIIELYRHKQHLEELVEEQACSLRESNEVMIDALSSVIEHRSLESGQHILRIRMFTKILLQNVAQNYDDDNELDNRKVDVIASAASMHDIGKIAIPDSILNKPGKLTDAEFEIMKTHTTKGCEILEGLGRMNDKEYLQYAYDICRYHHERWNGQGYPDGLRGKQIPIYAQVAGIADAYDALTTDRVYKGAFSHEKAADMILNGQCGVFSEKLLECFQNVGGQFEVLAQEYADGRSPHGDTFELKHPSAKHFESIQDGAGSKFGATGEMRYFALLKYVDSTVLEVDMDQGSYYMVYSPTSDFDKLRSGGVFKDVYEGFICNCIYPDERQRALDGFNDWTAGNFRKDRKLEAGEFRVVNQQSGEYRKYRVTIISIDSINRKSLIIWRKLGGLKHSKQATLLPAEEQRSRESFFGDEACLPLEERCADAACEYGKDKRENAELERKASTDELTGLYNRAAAQNLIEEYLLQSSEDQIHALHIVDIDDFKIVNDSCGHLVGDRLLEKISLCISEHFSSADIVGRIGGDEFIILQKDAADEVLIGKKAASLINSLSHVLSRQDSRGSISASMGISVYPKNGLSFEELFQKSGIALYSAKYKGKDQWRIYTGMNELKRRELLAEHERYSAGEHRIESILCNSEEDNIDIFKIFYESTDAEEGMKRVIDVMARRHGLNHVYIYEAADSGRKIFDWSADTTSNSYIRSSSPVMVAGEDIKAFMDENGTFICSDVRNLPAKLLECFEKMNISASIQVSIKDGDMLFGFAGFSQWNGPHQWSAAEIKACRFLARAVELFYLSKRSAERLKELNKVNGLLYDKIDAPSYIIDEAFAILQMNERMRNSFGFEPGLKCYALFQNSVRPCQGCPIMKLSKSCSSANSTITNGASGDVFEVTAANIEWKAGRKAYIMTCSKV